MKFTKDIRMKGDATNSGEFMRRASKLEPIKKSGKDRHNIYGDLDDDEDDLDLYSYKKKESILDYYDDDEDGDDDED